MNIVFRKSARISLRPLEEKDIPLFLKWMNDPEVSQFLMRYTPLGKAEEEEWFRDAHKQQHQQVFGIVLTKGNRLIGSMGLHEIRWKDRTAVSGSLIGEKKYWGKGYGSEAKRLLLQYAFETLGLHAVLSRVIGYNERSLKYAEKCGYTEVGRIPGWLRGQDGKRYDEVLLIATEESWRPLWEKHTAGK